MTTPSQVLAAARDFLTDPRHWTQGEYFEGVAACSMGAIRQAVGVRPGPYGDCPVPMTEPTWGLNTAAILYLSKAIGGQADRGIPYWNDHRDRKHAEVLAAFDRAIELALADEPTVIEREGRAPIVVIDTDPSLPPPDVRTSDEPFESYTEALPRELVLV